MDPHWLNADPDPAFFPNFGSGSNSESRVLMTKNWKKFTAVKLLYIFLIENCKSLILRPPKRTQRLQKSSAFNREHPALQNMEILYFFLYLWVIFALLYPDLATQINVDPDPDPQPWQEHLLLIQSLTCPRVRGCVAEDRWGWRGGERRARTGRAARSGPKP